MSFLTMKCESTCWLQSKLKHGKHLLKNYIILKCSISKSTDTNALIMLANIMSILKQDIKNTGNIRPGRLLLRFLEPNNLTLEKTLSRLGFSHVPLVLFGLLTQRQAFDFSRSLACLFCRIRELAIAAAMASLTVQHPKLSEDTNPFPHLLHNTISLRGSLTELTSEASYTRDHHCDRVNKNGFNTKYVGDGASLQRSFFLRR